MGCDLSKVYNIEIHLENELAVFEPRDEVAGHVIIQAEEDTVIDSCTLWLYGLVKTRWNGTHGTQKSRHVNVSGSVLGGISFLRSATNLSLFGESKTLENVCANTAAVLNTVADNVRSEVCQKIGQMRKGRLCYGGTLDCTPWELQPAPSNRRSVDWPTDLPPPTNTQMSSCTSTTDTLAASLEQSSNNSGGSVEAKYPDRTTDSSARELRPSSQILCRPCETCWPSAFGVKWKSLADVDQEDKTLCGDVKVIYRTKLSLLSGHSVQRQKDSIGGRSASEETGSNSTDTDQRRRVLSGESTELYSVEPTAGRTAQVQGQSSHSTDDDRTTNPSKPCSRGSASPYILTRGTHVFYFEFKLPTDLPSSFELPTGCLVGGAAARLYYGLRIEICNKAAQIRHTQHREIIVFRPLELTHFPRLRDRITLHKEFIISGCCASPKGSILCDLTVNKTGFVPGESITPQVHVTNRSSRPIQTVHLTFAQIVTLHGTSDQQHTETLRLFASRLKPQQPPNLDQNVRNSTRFTEDNPSLFSSSISPSSHTSLNKSDKPRANQLSAAGDRNNSSLSQTETTALFKSAVAVNSHGCSAYFEDVIHVPPLPATGLVGRQNLIQVEYALILRLRLQGDSQGRQDQKMQIPITVGSDPTRETSFTGCSEVVPCYASFNYASGEVIEYDPSTNSAGKSGHLRPVYRYFKPRSTKLNDLRSSTETIGQLSRTPSKSNDPRYFKIRSPSAGQRGLTTRKDTNSSQSPPLLSESPMRFSVVENPHANGGFMTEAYDRVRSNNQQSPAYEYYSEDISPETNDAYDSPPTPLLSGHLFFDDGNEEHTDLHSPTAAGTTSPYSRLRPQGQHKERNQTQVLSKVCSSSRLRSSSLGRQFSFNYDSDNTASESEIGRDRVADSAVLRPHRTAHTAHYNGIYSPNQSTHSDSETLSDQQIFISANPKAINGRERFPPVLPSSHTQRNSSVEQLNQQSSSRRIPKTYQLLRQIPTIDSDTQHVLTHSELIRDKSNSPTVPQRRANIRLHDAYWNRPRVAPVRGRNTQGIWTPGHVPSQPPASSTVQVVQSQAYDTDPSPTRQMPESSGSRFTMSQKKTRSENTLRLSLTQTEFTSPHRSLDKETFILENV
ncbi:hypothetical protein CLF_109133 [Clonorchis sinensis]|uniref:Arrestin C-terminal-like domain-containing protein n=1 Tax=Clonorchis sinensis TaxID=79923 RepID=G7YIZ7_CLOSI|nr:hypothetical protein CLF_109133 [Clonorchis sinensis]